MKEAYIDTSAFISFLDKSDSHHHLFRTLFSEPPKLITTDLVIAEGHGWFLRRYDSYRALQFLSMIDALETLKIVNLTSDLRKATEVMLRKFNDQDLTMADALGLHLIEANRLDQCWSTDFHLSLTGCRLVIHT